MSQTKTGRRSIIGMQTLSGALQDKIHHFNPNSFVLGTSFLEQAEGNLGKKRDLMGFSWNINQRHLSL